MNVSNDLEYENERSPDATEGRISGAFIHLHR